MPESRYHHHFQVAEGIWLATFRKGPEEYVVLKPNMNGMIPVLIRRELSD